MTTESNPGEQETGEQITVELIKGVQGYCVGVNNYRICGPKPWGGGSIERAWKTTKNDVLAAFLSPDERHQWLADDLTVVSVNSHTALEAERDALREALELVSKNWNHWAALDWRNFIINHARPALGETK